MAEFWEMDASEIAEGVTSRSYSARQVVESHLARLSEINPRINAVVQECPEEALAAADVLDDRLARGEDVGPLAGVPVTIKVNVDQKGYATTNGLKLQKDLIAKQDSPVVANLRRAGAVIVGRTNTPAFSMRWFTNNELHGMTLNPRNADLTPGGSSGGAAAAVAAGICAIGHGTDIAGSIRYPAYACGLQGIRPTVGRVPARNATAPDRYIGAQMMAVSGPIARSIADLRLGLAAMSVGDPEDPLWIPAPLTGEALPKKVAFCPAPDGMEVDDAVLAALTQAAEALRAAGWQVEGIDCPPIREAAEINAQLWMAESRAAAATIAAEDDPDATVVFQRMTADSAEMDLGGLMTCLQRRIGVQREWLHFLAEWPVVLCPSSGMLPFAQQSDVGARSGFDRIMEAQLIQRALPTLGLPGLSVATGMAGAAPVGVQLIGGKFREDILFDAGEVIEAACGQPRVTTPV